MFEDITKLNITYWWIVVRNRKAWRKVLRETWAAEKDMMIGYLKTGSSGEYLGPIGMRMGSGEGSTMRNFIVCTVHLI